MVKSTSPNFMASIAPSDPPSGSTECNVIPVSAETGITLHSVEPDGGSEGAIDAIKLGEVDLTITTGPRLLEGIRREEFLAIAAISDQRTPFYPEIPTMRELGLNTIGGGPLQSY